MKNKNIILTVLALSYLLISACSPQQQQTSKPAVSFTKSDECHICGMAITRFPGPKGQAYEKRSDKVRKFCSTMDLMVWALQPENKPNITDIYVHDMSITSWDSPDDNHLIPANNAVFVIGSSRQGAMGKTLASFSDKNKAEAFSEQYGGKVYAYQNIKLEYLLN